VREISFVGRGERGRETEATVVAHARSFPNIAHGKPWRVTGEQRGYQPSMIILGVILLVLGLIFGIGILWILGLVLVALGAILWVAGAAGHGFGGRPHYW
jgi:hypothetical protein